MKIQKYKPILLILSLAVIIIMLFVECSSNNTTDNQNTGSEETLNTIKENNDSTASRKNSINKTTELYVRFDDNNQSFTMYMYDNPAAEAIKFYI